MRDRHPRAADQGQARMIIFLLVMLLVGAAIGCHGVMGWMEGRIGHGAVALRIAMGLAFLWLGLAAVTWGSP